MAVAVFRQHGPVGLQLVLDAETCVTVPTESTPRTYGAREFLCDFEVGDSATRDQSSTRLVLGRADESLE